MSERDKEKWDGLPVVIFGNSGVSKDVKTIIDEINCLNYQKQFDLIGFIAADRKDVGKKILGSEIVSCDKDMEKIFNQYSQIGVVIPIGTPHIKKSIYESLSQYDNIVYPNIISPTAKIMNESSVNFGKGNIVCSGVVITEEISIGNFNLININCTIGHNTEIGSYCVINPLSSISGCVKIEDEVLCGAGCSIKQGIKIGKKSTIGLGAFVVKNVGEQEVMICDPCKKMKV